MEKSRIFAEWSANCSNRVEPANYGSMRKTVIKLWGLFVALTALLALSACTNEDDEQGGGSVQTAMQRLNGTWYLTSQKWTEEGKTTTAHYDASAQYAMTFDPTLGGSMQSGADALFEIESSHNFIWYVAQKGSKNCLYTNVYAGEEYQILRLTDSDLVLRWVDHDISIECQFRRARHH